MRELAVTLDAVIISVTDGLPRILLVTEPGRPPTIPSGALDPDTIGTLTTALRELVSHQTGIDVTYVEQLYTFGDLDRAFSHDTRDIAVGYVALTNEATPSDDSSWIDVYDLFPWEDQRKPDASESLDALLVDLIRWASGNPERTSRVAIGFAMGAPWDPMRVLDRYELLFEAGLVSEAGGDSPGYGVALRTDQRRIVATALGRLRGKLTYRPVIFEVMPDEFTLTHLQKGVEAIVGVELHKQNFRRQVERDQLVEPTGALSSETGGRPAALYRFRSEVVSERPRPGFPLPRSTAP